MDETHASRAVRRVDERLAEYYAGTLREHGATFAGVDMPKENDARLRYSLHLRAMEGRGVRSVLDIGCGVGLFRDFLVEADTPLARTLLENYAGVDSVSEMIEQARARHPDGRFEHRSLADGLSDVDGADFAIANGVFTAKGASSEEDMWEFLLHGLSEMWAKTRVGMSFDLMTTVVDYRYDWLFYVDPAELIQKLIPKFGRRFVIFNDTRLFDPTYVWIRETDGFWGSD